MNGDSKDSPEIVEFRRLFARLREWSDDDASELREIAHGDDGVRELALDILRVAGTIQRSEKSERDLFTGPVDPKFISDWRDFEERFANALLDIRSDLAVDSGDYFFSFDYYEQPDQWEVADLKAIGAARSLDAVILFAEAQGEHALKDSAEVAWRPFNVNAASDEVRRAFGEMSSAAGKAEDAYEHLRSELHHQLRSARDERETRKYLDILRELEQERCEDEMPIEEVAKDAFEFWEIIKSRSGLDLRGILRRRALIPFVLFPRHVSARLSKSDLPSIYQTLRQAHDAFVFGAPAAALALIRSVMEMAVRDHYRASGSNLDELIDSVAARLPRRANAPALHRLRRLANRVLHGEIDEFSRPNITRREFELEIVSLLFVLRALIEGAPQASGRVGGGG